MYGVDLYLLFEGICCVSNFQDLVGKRLLLSLILWLVYSMSGVDLYSLL